MTWKCYFTASIERKAGYRGLWTLLFIFYILELDLFKRNDLLLQITFFLSSYIACCMCHVHPDLQPKDQIIFVAMTTCIIFLRPVCALYSQILFLNLLFCLTSFLASFLAFQSLKVRNIVKNKNVNQIAVCEGSHSFWLRCKAISLRFLCSRCLKGENLSA